MCHNSHQCTVSVMLLAASLYYMSVMYLTFSFDCENGVVIWVHRNCVLFTYAVGIEGK